jgi:thioredoxin reductase (NADPH)
MSSVGQHTSHHTDCVIIGAGPAGISAALWLHAFEVPFRWFSTNGHVGGLLDRVNNRIGNYPGGNFPSGAALVEAFKAQLDHSDLTPPSDGHVLRLSQRPDNGWRITFVDEPALVADTVILATGTRYRSLGVTGEAEGMGQCVSQSATADGERFTGETVAVVGGGDAGFENALRLADHGCKVWMLLRNADFEARDSFVERVQANPQIEFYPFPTTVTEIRPHTHKNAGADGGCQLLLDVDGDRQSLDVACLFVRIGVDPVTPQIEPGLEVRSGFVVVDSRQRTSAAGLFAAGDVTASLLRSVATAVGTGATAAKAVALNLGRL